MKPNFSVTRLKEKIHSMNEQQIELTITELENEQKLYKRADVYMMYVLLYKQAEAIRKEKVKAA